LGGSLQLSGGFYKPLVGAVLLFAAARLLWPRALAGAEEPHDPPIVPALFIGAAVGLLSGLTGTGGGIFLSPVILFLGWSAPKTTSGVAAVFILCNSIAGLAGNLSSVQHLPPMLPLYAAAVLSGALVGTTLGIRFRNPGVLKALGLVEIVAGAKLFGLF
jgi:uncharacterized membrane protein YfcA